MFHPVLKRARRRKPRPAWNFWGNIFSSNQLMTASMFGKRKTGGTDAQHQGLSPARQRNY
jgi:hypothetical protein